VSPRDLPAVPGVLSAAELDRTVDTIAALQLPSGMVPWFPGGHADPWNHIEAGMALLIGGRRAAAERAFDWLIGTQRADGAWHHYYLADRVEQDKLEANVTAYVATGAWHHWLLTGDRGFLDAMWPVVERAIDFVLDLQTPRGEIIWARLADGTPWSFALLSGSSSICHSLRCAVAIADELSHDRPDWELSLARLAHVIRTRPDGAFAPKNRWAMDWYYPVLCGAVAGDDARAQLAARRDTFVMQGRGVRCVSDRPWVTAAETCECALAYLGIGDHATARELFTWAQQMRLDDGRYWTGTVYPAGEHFPADETSAYTAAAVVLTADALAGATTASRLFTTHESLPRILSLEDDLESDPSRDH
jgi:hypothetical protein